MCTCLVPRATFLWSTQFVRIWPGHTWEHYVWGFANCGKPCLSRRSCPFLHRFMLCVCIDVGSFWGTFWHICLCFFAIVFLTTYDMVFLYIYWYFFSKMFHWSSQSAPPLFVTFLLLFRRRCFGRLLVSSFGSISLLLVHIRLHVQCFPSRSHLL